MNTDATQIQLLLSVVLVYAQNWLKQQAWFPVINYEKSNLNSRINNFVSIIATGAVSLGIHFTFNSQSHELVISGLQWSAIGGFFLRWLSGYIGSKVTYTVLKDKLNPPAETLPKLAEIKH